MKNIILISLFLLANTMIFAQNSKNQTYKRWIYLDENWKALTDTSNYSYKRLTTIEGRTNIHPMGEYGKDHYHLKKEGEFSDEKSKILHGTYAWYDQSGTKKSEHVFINGEYIHGKEFWKNGNIRKHFDFTTHPKEDSLAYYIYLYNKKMTVLEVISYQKNENGEWPKSR